jgi:hypothetical protein
MSYQPVLPVTGVAGWTLLKRTLPAQQAAFDKSAVTAREVKYFEENIGKATTAEALVKDPILLKVALGAFGLSDEYDKKAYIQKALEGGTEDPKAMANRIVDRKYRDMAGAFGFGDSKGAQTGDADFTKEVVSRYRVRQFEQAVGALDGSLRIAMNFDREAAQLAAMPLTDRAAWTRVLGDVPIRTVIEKAMGLPKQFSQLDVDRQLDVLQDKSARLLPDGVRSLADPAIRERIIRTYLARDQAEQFTAQMGGSAALSILQNVSNGMRQSANLFASRLR